MAEFIPGVTEYGEIYYVYAVAGNSLGNEVDFSDPCREISLPVAVRWRASPTVVLTNNNNCLSGCLMIDVVFTGKSPFTLTYQVSAGGTTQTFTQVFTSTTGSFEVCPPAGFLGQMDVTATALEDAFCTCD